MISAAHMLGGSWACSLRKFLKKKCNLVRFDVPLHTMLGPPRQVPSHAIYAAPLRSVFSFLAYYMGAPSDQCLGIEYGGPLRSISSLIMEASLCCFFSNYMGAPRFISLHTILGPPDHFLRLLYGAPQISFFSYNMGAPLRSVSLFTIWGPPPQISFFACYRRATSDFSFFTKYMGAPSDQFLRLLYMGPLRLVSLLTMGPPQISFCEYFLGVPLGSVFSLTIYGGPPQVSFFAYCMGAPLRSFSSHTI